MSNTETNPQEKGKEAEKFKKNHSMLVALLNGESLLRRSRLPIDDVATAMEELVKDRKEEAVKAVKKEANELIDSYIAFEKFKKEQEDAFAKALMDKQKDFNQKAGKLFGIVEGIKEMETTYYNALKGASTVIEPAPTEEGRAANPEE